LQYQKSNDKLNSINKVNSIVCFLLCIILERKADQQGLKKRDGTEKIGSELDEKENPAENRSGDIAV